MSWPRRLVNPLLNHGWVTAEFEPNSGYWMWVRITPAGFRALAAATEKHGLPAVEVKYRATITSNQGEAQ